MYICECGKKFDDLQKFLGHKGNCEIHLKAVGKDFWIGENRTSYVKDRLTKKYGTYEEYCKHLSEKIKESYYNKPGTLTYYLNTINKDEFINEYITQNKPRTYMRKKYGISDYMMDKIVESFGCRKNKKECFKLGIQARIDRYGADNINNWKKGQETRVKNSGSLKASYAEAMQKQQETMIEKYGVRSGLQLDFVCERGHKKFSGPNQRFARELDIAGLQYSREFALGTKSFDFKVDNILIEINPTITHNCVFSPFGNHEGLPLEYHKEKRELAEENGFRCVHVWDWDDIKKVSRILLSRDKVYARNCTVQIINKDIVKEYLDNYHLQSYAKDTVRIALVTNNEIVSVMTFAKPRYSSKYEWELIRYCSHCYVLGGAEKLFHYFVSEYSPASIISYCDRSKFQGSIYSKLGFISKGISYSKHWHNPYTGKHITDNLLRQRGFDQLLGKEYGCFGKGTSNEELMLQHSFYPIVDAGQETFVWSC